MGASNAVSEKVRERFADVAIMKDPRHSSYFSSKSIPSFLRDWIIMRFADEKGSFDVDAVDGFIRSSLPGPNDWEPLKARMMNNGEQVRFLSKVRVELDVKTGEALFSLPQLGFPRSKYEAFVERSVLSEHEEELLSQTETWGIVLCKYGPSPVKPNSGAIWLVDYKPFRPYRVDVDYYREARRGFSLDEWLDALLMATDYNPDGFLTEKQKLTLLSRLLPFVERRVNLVELAPKGTGKSYMMSQISKYGWLISGGSITRAKLFYDLQKKTPGLVSRYDFVVLDEIQTVSFPNEEEIAGALKGFLESGECRVGSEKVTGEAGFVLMGNIDGELMDEGKSFFQQLPPIFSESALLDRFHGFIRGWDIPRMKENMKARGWALNVEYFSEILHALRDEMRYSHIVNETIEVPRSADHRDVTAIKRIATGFLKLLFPHVEKPGEVPVEEFEKYCLAPALEMRRDIKRQLHYLDPHEYQPTVPDIALKS